MAFAKGGIAPFGAGKAPWGAGKAAPAAGVAPWGAGKAAAGVAPWGAGKAAGVAPWGAGKAAPAAGVAPAGACSTMYGPVANVCQSAVPFTGFIPATTVTPVPTGVVPQTSYGQPVTTQVGTPAVAAPVVAQPFVAPVAPGVGAFSAFQSPWGGGKAGTVGAVPGIYTSEVGMPGIW